MFRDESARILEVLDGSLKKLQQEPQDFEALQEIRQAILILRGAASAVEMRSVTQLAEYMEDLLGQIFASGAVVPSEVHELLTESRDALQRLIFDTGEHAQQSVEPLLSLYASLLQGDLDESPPEYAMPEDVGDGTGEHHENDEPVCPELFEVFREEAEDILRQIYSALGQLENAGDDRGALQDVRRAAHTLKGAAGAVGLRQVTRLAHRMEDLLDKLYDGGLAVPHESLQVLYRGTDCLQELATHSGDTSASAQVIDQLFSEIAALVNGQPAISSADRADFLVEPQCCSAANPDLKALDPDAREEIHGAGETVGAEPAGEGSPATRDGKPPNKLPPAVAGTADNLPAIPSKPTRQLPGQVLRVSIEQLDQLEGVVGELVVNRSRFQQCMTYLGNFVDELHLSAQRLQHVSDELSDRVVDQPRLRPPSPQPYEDARNLSGRGGPGADASVFDPLELDRYTDFHPLRQSLVEASDDLGTLGERIQELMSELNSLLNQQGRLSYDTQDRLMGIRTVSLDTLVPRLRRAVRSVANETGKQVALTLEGQDIELDKKVLDGMADPLLHLLRNAVDHGIESPEERIAQGKPEHARIHVRAFHRGSQVIIRVSDDGRGLQTDALRQTAIERGIVSGAAAAAMSDEQVHGLIFHAGFSTAAEVSEFSGRGVGMDIVRQHVQQLKGTIHVASTPRRGTIFSISLPMSLSMTKAIMVCAGDEMFAIPMSAIRHICRVPADVGADGQRIVGVDGRSYPLVHLADQLNLERKSPASDEGIPVLMVDSGDGHVALRVDRVLPSRDVIVKTLGSHLRRVPGLAGATLLGDGTVVPILEIGELLDEAHSVETQHVQKAVPLRPDPLTVLLVDDSVSVRKVMSKLISNAGWRPVAAKDGIDALETLEELADRPQIILLDVEMPRMDGFELLSTLRSDRRFCDIPVVMISSRAGEKHRRRARELGAKNYIVKPFQERTLLGLICQLTGKAGETVLA